MKNKLILSIAAFFQLALTSFGNFYPEGIAVHPTENLMVIAHESGNIILIEKTTYKHLKTVKVFSEIESISFNNNGSHLWVLGVDADDNDGLIQLNSSTWEKTAEIACEKAVFSFVGNKLAYKKDYFATEIKLIDLTSAELVGSLKMTFTNEKSHADYFEFSPDGKTLIMGENVYGESPCEILFFPTEGFVSKPLKSVISASKISSGFGTGACSLNNEHVLIGWSETIKVGSDAATVINRGYDYCYSFCASPDGKYFFIGTSSGRASRYEFSTMKKTEVSVEEMKGATGNIMGICTTDGKLYHFITEDYIVGTINPDGFVLKQNFISMNVNVILDSYETKELETIRAACKSNGCNVEIPDEYDEENPPVIATNISMSAAYTLIEKMDDADVYCLVSIIEP